MQTRQDMRQIKKDMGVLLEAVHVMAGAIVQMQKRPMDETLTASSE